MNLTGRRIGVQLYGTDPNERLMAFLASAGAVALPVAPYIYAPASHEDKVADLIQGLANGGIDEGAPGLRPYHASFYACYVRDPDGNKLSVVCESES